MASPIRFSWGTGIALVYTSFVLLMIGAVVASSRQNPGLVRKNYYDLDLNYQEHFDKKQRAANLAHPPQVSYDRAAATITLQFPDHMNVSEGRVKLFRAGDNTGEKWLDLGANPGNRYTFPAQDFPDGRWHVEIDWKAAGEGYYLETTLQVHA